MQQSVSALHRLAGIAGRRLLVAVPLVWLAVFLLPLLETFRYRLPRPSVQFHPMRRCGGLMKLVSLPISRWITMD